MNSREFARKWLEKQGLFNVEESGYEDWLGAYAMSVVDTLALLSRGNHIPMLQFVNILDQIYKAYCYGLPDNGPIWKEHVESGEYKAE